MFCPPPLSRCYEAGRAGKNAVIAFRPSFEILILPQTFNRIGLKIQGEFRIEAKFKTRAAIIAGGDCIGRRRGGGGAARRGVAY